MHRFSVILPELRVASPGDILIPTIGNVSTFPGLRIITDADIQLPLLVNVSVFPVHPLTVVEGSVADITLPALVNASTFPTLVVFAAPADQVIRFPALINESQFLIVRETDDGDTRITEDGDRRITGASFMVEQAPVNQVLRFPALVNASTFPTLTVFEAASEAAGSSAGTSTAAASSAVVVAAAGASAGSATVAASSVTFEAGAGASAGTSTTAATGVRIAAGAGSSAGTSTAAAAAPPPGTTFDPAITGRAPDFVLSGGNLTARGNTTSVMIALDLDNKRIWAKVSANAWSGSGDPATNTGGNDITSVVSGSVFPAWSAFNAATADQATINGDGSVFQNAIPSGFSALGSTLTWDSSNKDASITLSNGNKTAAGTAGASAWKSVRANIGKTSGKWVFEVTADAVDASSGWMLGCENASGSLSSFVGSTGNGAGYMANKQFYINGGASVSPLPQTITPYVSFLRSIRTAAGHTTGKYYVEVAFDAIDGGNGWLFGVCNASQSLAQFVGQTNNSAGFQTTRQFWKNNSPTANALTSAPAAGHILCLAIDLDHNRMWGRVDNNSWSGTSGDPATNTGGFDIASVNDSVAVYLVFTTFDQSPTRDQASVNTGSVAFTYSVPSGFTAGF